MNGKDFDPQHERVGNHRACVESGGGSVSGGLGDREAV